MTFFKLSPTGTLGMCLIQIAEDWQTLIAALIALAAAIWTIRSMNSQARLLQTQINEERERHLDAKSRKTYAVRAQIPDALSALIRYCEGCFQFEMGEVPNLPAAPSEAISRLKESIEHIDVDTAASVFELVSFYQVHNARLSRHDRNPHHAESIDRMYDTVLLRYYADRLYEYARNETDSVAKKKPTRAEMISMLRQTVGLVRYVGNDERYTLIRERIELRHPQEANG